MIRKREYAYKIMIHEGTKESRLQRMSMRLRLGFSICLALVGHLRVGRRGIEDSLALPSGAGVGATHSSHLDHLIVLVPEIAFAACCAHDPWWQNASHELVRPGLLVHLSGWDDTTARGLLDDPDGGVDDGVGNDATDETVGNGVGERHDGEGDERGDGVARVAPVNCGSGLAHHGADDDEGAAGGPGRDGREDRGEEDGDEEAEARDYGGDTSFAAFGDAGTGFDEGGYGGQAKEGTDCDAEG